MLRPRIIPVLLIKDKGLVKTVKFKNPTYVGDPINAVKIFNEKEVDELAVLDIDASVYKREPDYKMIENLASECRMPLCYGGGIKTLEQANRILSLGVEKVAISSAAIENTELITCITEQVGRQSIVAVIDVRKKLFGSQYEVFTHGGKRNTKLCPFKMAITLEDAGAGEIILNSIDNDGTMRGYDLDLIHKVNNLVAIPITAVGGAGSLSDILSLFRQEGLIGGAAGSLFVFKGKYRAVLINYPKQKEKKALIEKILHH